MSVVIYHNPACSKSRQVLDMLREAGCAPEIVAYLKTGWTRPQLTALLADAGLSAQEALRKAGARAKELGLLQAGVSEAAILDAMLAHPELVERPIVRTSKGARLCRPPERVLELIGPLPDRPDT